MQLQAVSNSDRHRVAGRSGGYPNFAALLGPQAWSRLPAAVRARFGAVHRSDEAVQYEGSMQRVEANLFGRVLAQLARVFETPVAPWTGSNVDVCVRVYPRPAVNGVVWERIYRFAGRAPVTVRSTKCLNASGRLNELLGHGLSMELAVTEEDGALKFTSTGYCFDLFGFSVRLPAWMPPGTTHVIHKDIGDGYFRFTMYTEHPWFGTMFFQDGVFSRREIST